LSDVDLDSSSLVSPFVLHDVSARDVLLQEFLAGLKSHGAASVPKMHRDGLTMFKVPAPEADLLQLALEATNFSYVTEEPADPRYQDDPVGPRFKVAARGWKLPAPSSLHVRQLATTLLGAAGPVHENVARLYRVSAGALAGSVLVSGASAKQALEDKDPPSIWIRIAAVLLLVGVFVVHFRAELWLANAARAWPYLSTEAPRVAAFYGLPRIVWTAVFNAMFVAAFAIVILAWDQWRWAVIPAALWLILAVFIHFKWRRPSHKQSAKLRKASKKRKASTQLSA